MSTNQKAAMSPPIFRLLFLVACAVCLVHGGPAHSSYMAMRNSMVQEDRATRTGSRITLTKDEKTVSDYMVKLKKNMMESCRLNKTEYYPSLSFFKSKPLMEQSKLFKIFRKMPKGGALHLHDMSITSLEWVVKNVTYRDNLYMCVDAGGYMIFRFSLGPPDTSCSWSTVKERRSLAQSIDDFDESIRKNISYLTLDPLEAYADGDKAWVRFDKYFEQVIGMVFHAPVFKDYFSQALKEFNEDNVQYIELRGQMFDTFELNGDTHDAEYGLNMYKTAIEDFKKKNPDFIDAKFIMSGLRFKPVKDIKGEVQTAMKLYQKYPGLFLGYDLVGQEDPHFSLLHYLDALLMPSQQNPPVKLPYFFHAAETNWQGTAVDYNLVDALLLNTTRIGHGYALDKHPHLAQEFRDRKIAFEVNPISNQVLRIVSDLRNHAMVPLLASDFPVVLSSDDPTTWEAAPLSHDLFLAFMTMCAEDDDLRFMKQLILNSLEYSAMSDQEKTSAKDKWQKRWDAFIKDTVASINSGHLGNGTH